MAAGKGDKDRGSSVQRANSVYYNTLQANENAEYNEKLVFKFAEGETVTVGGIPMTVYKHVYRGELVGDSLPMFSDPGPRYSFKCTRTIMIHKEHQLTAGA